MICREWHGWTKPEQADQYVALLRDEIFPGIARKGVAGYHGIELLRRADGGEVEFVTLMRFESLDAVRAFAGEEADRAVVPPKARALLSRFDERSVHYEVLEPQAPDFTGEVARLREELRRAWNDEPWHGPSMMELVNDIDAASASERPIPGGHTIWELVLHMTGWIREVSRRVDGAPANVPPEGDWPPVTAMDAQAWNSAREQLSAAHAELFEALERLPDQSLGGVVPVVPGAQTASGVSLYRMLHGIVQHDAYHAGQIMMLRKAALRR